MVVNVPAFLTKLSDDEEEDFDEDSLGMKDE